MKSNRRDPRSENGWIVAVSLIKSFRPNHLKADEQLANAALSLGAQERRRCQAIFYCWLRNRTQVDWELKRWMKKKPRPEFYAVLRTAVAEMLDVEEKRRPKVVNYAVTMATEICSKGEGKAANAILRKVLNSLNNGDCAASAPLHIQYSHPEWMVEHWVSSRGEDKAKELLEWNQQIPEVYIRVFGQSSPSEFLKETNWPDFYKWEGKRHEMEEFLQDTRAYVQDPLTRHPAELLKIAPGEHVLDLCAAPGGKTASFADALISEDPDQRGSLIAVDLPGKRLERFDENMKRLGLEGVQVVGADITLLKPSELNHIAGISQFDAVCLDAPCSNTGVLRRRPDARWRLNANVIKEQSAVQLGLLKSAAQFVTPGGRLLYSTCSIETEENQSVIDSFIQQSNDTFELITAINDFPPTSDHDGGGCFLLRKK